MSDQNIDRLPPNAPDAEMAVLSCQLRDPQMCLPMVVDGLDANEGAFYDLRNQTIQKAMFSMWNSGSPVNVITVCQKLKDEQTLDQVGGAAYISQVEDLVPSAHQLDFYLKIIKEKFLLRQMISACSTIVGKIYDDESDVAALLDDAEASVLRVSASINQSKVEGIKKLVQSSLVEVERIFSRDGKIGGISTGYPDLDKMTDGLHGGDMVVIAGRPSMGKTSLAMGMAENVAVEQGIPVGVFSLEMTAKALTTRQLCCLARVDLRSIQNGCMAESDFPKLMSASGRLSTSPLFIDDSSGLSVMQMRARARRMVQQHGIKLFVIDYLQLLNSIGSRARDNRQQEIADISGGIKSMAKELDVPVIVLSQLNRDIEKDKHRKPRLADLRESGALEQDADLVALLYKPQQDEDDEVDESAIAVNLLIAKQRNGPTGDVALTFLKPYTRFESRSRLSDEDRTCAR
jgi:replicative DNA helicase